MKWCIAAIAILCARVVSAQDSVTISGRIQNPQADSVKVVYNDNRIAYYPRVFHAAVDGNGRFSLAFPVPHGIYIQAELVHGRKGVEMILHPGDNLDVTADAAHFDSSIHFTGKGSEIANFVSRHKTERGVMNQYTIKLKTAINLLQGDFLKQIEEERLAEMHFLEKYKSQLPASFIQYWTAYYQYYNYFFIEQYPQVHEMIKKRRYTDTIPEENYRVVAEMPYAFYDSLLQVPSYLLYLTGVFETKLRSKGYAAYPKETNKMKRFEDSVYTLGYQLLPPESGEYFIAQNIYGRARTQPIERTEKQFANFRKRWPGSSYIPELEKQIATAMRLAKGQQAADINIITREGKQMKLSDLRGKVVYLGFWAAWCKQCVTEMIREDKMKDLLKNKPVEFVYVSINSDTAADNRIISRFKIQGAFSQARGGWNSEEVLQYGVQQLPAYFLIDADGKFALQNTPDPGHYTELILEIEKLLK